jgi:hypothetical protein
MVHPRLAVSLILTLSAIGAAISLIIPGTLPKFRGRILGQIMRKSLPDHPHPETGTTNQKTMCGNGFKMLPRFHSCSSLL